MNKSVKRWERYSLDSLAKGTTDDRGLLFLSELGQVNLDQVRILHSGLDTVRQLYSGVLNPKAVEYVKTLYEQGFDEMAEIGGIVWAVGSGGASGYQYRLQNNDTGLIVLLKSRYADLDKEGSHLKIECSPHWIVPRDAERMESDLDSLASLFFSSRPSRSGCAVHLCVDVQGWEPPRDFADSLVTRARRSVDFNAKVVDFMDFGNVSARFNRGQSYLLGSASTVQFSLYRKDEQALAVDKLDFWNGVWSRVPGESFDTCAYDPSKPVWRFEFRFHHSVLADFGRGVASGQEYGFSVEHHAWASVRGVSRHLQGLWEYGLSSFRLERRASVRGAAYLDPMWQFLFDDVKVAEPQLDVLYKRVKKTPGLGNEKNLLLAVGNLLSVYARNRFTAARAFDCLKASGVYDDLYEYMNRRAYYRQELFDESKVFQFVQKALSLRILQGKAA